MANRFTLTTEDGVSIEADFYPSDGNKFALLLHMMPATKESWKPFVKVLVQAGYSCLAIDERGHGESEGGPGGYKEFTDKEQQAKMYDVRVAFAFLQERGATPENAVVIGASIGANLSIVFLGEQEAMTRAVALSPGVDYRGVVTEPAIRSLAAGQRVLLVASEEDVASAKSIKILHEANPAQTTLRMESGLGHGTAMFENKPELMNEVITWLQS